jgi:hypothetical protein
MSSELDLIAQAFTNISQGDEVEMVSSLAEERNDGIRGLLAPDAEVRFLALDETNLSENTSAFIGPDGYLAGWLEWLQPYETFRARLLGISDVEGSRVLLEIAATALLRGSRIEVAVEAAALYGFRSQQIVCADHYLSLAQARREAGVA